MAFDSTSVLRSSDARERLRSAGALLLLVAGCGRAEDPSPPPATCGEGAWALETVVEPELEVDPSPWDDWETTAEWLDEGCLRIYARRERQGFGEELYLILSLMPPRDPRAFVRAWEHKEVEGSEVELRFWDVQGRARVSADGAGLGEPGGPDLAIAYEFAGNLDVSWEERSGGLRLASEQLLRR